jgi:hypothetical protein
MSFIDQGLLLLSIFISFYIKTCLPSVKFTPMFLVFCFDVNLNSINFKIIVSVCCKCERH